MGPSRSLDGCYRLVMNADRAARGRERLLPGARCPAVWRKRAKEFDWWVRAEAWDEEERRLSFEVRREALKVARNQSLVVVGRLVDLMMGELRVPDGALVPGLARILIK